MSARDDYQYGERGAQHYTMCDEIDLLRDRVARLRAELARWGWGDFHYGDQPQDRAIVALLEDTA